MKEKYLQTGKIVSVQGLNGEVRVYPWCNDAQSLCSLKKLYMGKEYTPVEITKAHVTKNVAIMKLSGVDTVEAAQKLRDTVLYVDREDIELDENSNFIADIIGLEVRDDDTGCVYGKVKDVLQTGANDVYVIEDDNKKTYLMPAVKAMVPTIDVESGYISVKPIPGIFDEGGI